AYSGIYRLEEDRWITKVDTAWNEALIGTEQVRLYRLEGDTLTVTTPWGPFVNFGGRVVQATLTWVKVK
ncbi:MAG TPA: lipocalin-like domain-containing protein, partial [Candidatus Acidoferrales bacterium]|nr:lipocalin-like domain-containing protein [Candidatus Acidoferrales bacterium]